MNGIGIGESDFKILRIKNNYYIDKTKYIKDIIDNRSISTINNTTKKIRKNIKYEYVKILFWLHKKRQ